MDVLQNLIHKLEVGGGIRKFSRYFKAVAIVAAVVLTPVCFDWRGYRNMSTQEGMDAAQLGRNLAEGRGYTTLFVRPFSMQLINAMKPGPASLLALPEAPGLAPLRQLGTEVKWQIETNRHPDISNPPAYPAILAGLMKVLPFHYTVNTNSAFWSRQVSTERPRMFWRYQPDFLIAVFNQGLLLLVVLMNFFLARRLFSSSIAWVSAIVLLGSELLWRFSVSGLSTMLLLLIFTGLAWCLVLFEEEAREPRGSIVRLFLLAAAIGLMIGVGALTRYSFAWLLLPALILAIVIAGQRAIPLAATIFIVTAAVFGPWIARNYIVSGTPFGTQTYTLAEFGKPRHELQRSSDAQPGNPLSLPILKYKLMGNAREMIQNELPKIAGTYVSAFFLVGLMVGFYNPTVSRLRWFILGALAVLFLAQALGRTQLSEDSPEINSEHLLVLLTPLIVIYGVALFYVLLDQLDFSIPSLRYVAIGLFAAVGCLPMLMLLVTPKVQPVVAQYRPDKIQALTAMLKPDEWVCTDVPWAVAWYGHRQSLWLPLRPMHKKDQPSDLVQINDQIKRISATYLTLETGESKVINLVADAAQGGWWLVYWQGFMAKELQIPDFPTKCVTPGFGDAGQVVLTDLPRARAISGTAPDGP